MPDFERVETKVDTSARVGHSLDAVYLPFLRRLRDCNFPIVSAATEASREGVTAFQEKRTPVFRGK